MSDTCKDCKWWARNNVSEMGDSHKTCYHPSMSVDDYHALLDGVCSSDPESGMCLLLTGPDFGCIHFELKPE